MNVGQEFKSFLLKQNALALAVGVVIGGATSKVVSGIVDDIIMPIVGIVMPGGEWRQAQFTLSANNAIKYGDLLGRFVDFIIVSAVVFAIVRALIKPEATAPTKVCNFCKETIPIAATKCRACASNV